MKGFLSGVHFTAAIVALMLLSATGLRVFDSPPHWDGLALGSAWSLFALAVRP